MVISVRELRDVTNRLLAHLEDRGLDEIELPVDYYWSYAPEDRYDVEKDPAPPTIGQLSDDWNELLKIQRGEAEPLAYAFVWLSSVLRAVGEREVV